MKKQVLFAIATMTLVSCSSDELVNSSSESNEAPIAFSVEQKNITRGTALESLERYNFGVWAYKYKDGATTQNVMNNYLVGYSDNAGKGYYVNEATTWSNASDAATDHTNNVSPWFYENLGTAQYLNEDATKGYTKGQSTYMSANANQYLRYWDLAYTTTNFYAYTPYNNTQNGVTFDETNKKMTVADGILSAGYSAPANEFLYAGATATNANMQDVTLKFYHLGAQVKLRFYEDIEGYDVKIIDVTSTTSGIQATPATYSETEKKNVKAEYYKVCGAEIDYSKSVDGPTATATYGTDASSKTNVNLEFAVPTGTIPQAGETSPQEYAESGTTYYAVPQPTDSKVGFTFHVSYTLTAKDNNETITVHDARVFVPAKDASDNFVAAWQPNTIYYYTFKITKDATGTTDPGDENIDPTSPTIPTTKALYPIVFDGATVEEYKTANSERTY